MSDFETWYQRVYPTILGAALAVSGGRRDLAEDACADAFVKAYRSWSRVAAMDSPVGWTARVATRRSRQLLRSEALRGKREIRTGHAELMSEPQGNEYSDEIWNAVRRLSPRQRESLALRYIEDMSQHEVASAMGIATGTAAATLNQARIALREELLQETD